MRQLQIVACGTSFHAGLVAKYWLESIARMPCQVDIASDYRYRDIIVEPGTLFVAVSQSGETADTLAALRYAGSLGHVATLAICNVATSSLVRESDYCLLTMAGQEIGVASTKAFTTQLTLLLILAIVLGRRNGLSGEDEARLVSDMNRLPELVHQTLRLDRQIRQAVKTVLGQAPQPVSRPRHTVPGSQGGRTETEGNFLHPRRSLSRRRTQARPARTR